MQNKEKTERKWVSVLKNIVAFVGWVIAAFSLMIPDQVEYVLKAVIEAFKMLLNAL